VTTAAAALQLDKVPGEGSGESVFSGRRDRFAFFVTHEYEAAPWSWVIVEDKDPVAFGDAVDHRTALLDLSATLDTLSPPPPPPRPRAGGVVGVIGRLLWGGG
jgi:hypothetical protein